MTTALLDRIEHGASLPDAAAAEGLHASTLKGWLTRGRKEEAGDYAEFAAAVEVARSTYREKLEQPMDRDDLEREVWRSVRAGSVAAMKLAWEILKAKEGEDADQGDASDPFSELDGASPYETSPVVQLDNERRRLAREKRRSTGP